MKSLASLLAIAVLLMACAPLVSPPKKPALNPQVVHVGDGVHVMTTDGEMTYFQVTAIDETRIAGEGIELRADQVRYVEVDAPLVTEPRDKGVWKSIRESAGAIAGPFVGFLVIFAVL
jgi:hypothetical protein